MKSNTNLSPDVFDKLGPAIMRADVTVGQALKAWLVEETRSGSLDFSDIALALHFVLARECASHALSRCSTLNAEQMQEHYCALVQTCFKEQFEANIRQRKDV